jgi:hypothetical protein
MNVVDPERWGKWEAEKWQYNLQKKRLALCLGFGALGGVSACLLLKFYAGLAVVTAVMPPAALVTLPIAAAVIVGGLAFLAIRALRAYKSHADVQYPKDDATAKQKHVEVNAQEGVCDLLDEQPPIPKKRLHRLADALYGEEPMKDRSPFSFWGRLFSRAPVAPPLMDRMRD